MLIPPINVIAPKNPKATCFGLVGKNSFIIACFSETGALVSDLAKLSPPILSAVQIMVTAPHVISSAPHNFVLLSFFIFCSFLSSYSQYNTKQINCQVFVEIFYKFHKNNDF